VKSSDDVFDPSRTFLFRPVTTAYVEALSGDLARALLQSVTIATCTTALVLLIAIPAAYGLARTRGPLPTAALGLLIVLQMMPQTATVIPLFQAFSGWRLLDTTAAVVLADAALLTPFATLLLRPFFRAVPPQIEEASSIDGAGMFRTFWSVVLPVARNGVATVGTLTFLLAWGEFLYAVNFYLTPGQYPLSALLAQQVMRCAAMPAWPRLSTSLCMARASMSKRRSRSTPSSSVKARAWNSD
jgi:multiple sugar transport system permease protein